MTETDIPVVRPTVLITGPTSGIGAAMLQRLMSHPARPNLVLLARDGAALEGALRTARAAGLSATGIPVDLADLGSVRGALQTLADRIGSGDLAPIDAALLNAGAQFTSRRKTGVQGHELTFTVNVIAQHLLLRGLEALLSPGGQAVLMGSSTHRGKKASIPPAPRRSPPPGSGTAEASPTRRASSRS